MSNSMSKLQIVIKFWHNFWVFFVVVVVVNMEFQKTCSTGLYALVNLLMENIEILKILKGLVWNTLRFLPVVPVSMIMS